MVDAVDLNTAILNWTGPLSPCRGPSRSPAGAFDGDCDVDALDLTTLIVHWTGAGAQASRVRPVPEPSALGLLAGCGLALLVRANAGRGRIGGKQTYRQP